MAYSPLPYFAVKRDFGTRVVSATSLFRATTAYL
jgi:hypothetical protein